MSRIPGHARCPRMTVVALASAAVMVSGCAPVLTPLALNTAEVAEQVTTAPANPTGQATVTDTPPTAEVDWNNYPIIVNGKGVAANFATVDPNSIFPTHIPFVPVLEALHELGLHDGNISVTTLDDGRQQFKVMDLNGRELRFESDSAEFSWESPHESGGVMPAGTPNPADYVRIIDGDVYVPISFFRDVFGIEYVAFEGGHVIIETVAPADMH